MKHVFADTSFYLALLRPDDQDHGAAFEAASGCLAHITTTEFVLCELGNALSGPLHRGVFINLVGQLRANPRVTIVPASAQTFEAGMELFTSAGDKGWSIVDCTSFAVMKRLRIREAMTADRHFEQAGFRALLRRPRGRRE